MLPVMITVVVVVSMLLWPVMDTVEVGGSIPLRTVVTAPMSLWAVVTAPMSLWAVVTPSVSLWATMGTSIPLWAATVESIPLWPFMTAIAR